MSVSLALLEELKQDLLFFKHLTKSLTVVVIVIKGLQLAVIVA